MNKSLWIWRRPEISSVTKVTRELGLYWEFIEGSVFLAQWKSPLSRDFKD